MQQLPIATDWRRSPAARRCGYWSRAKRGEVHRCQRLQRCRERRIHEDRLRVLVEDGTNLGVVKGTLVAFPRNRRCTRLGVAILLCGRSARGLRSCWRQAPQIGPREAPPRKGLAPSPCSAADPDRRDRPSVRPIRSASSEMGRAARFLWVHSLVASCYSGCGWSRPDRCFTGDSTSSGSNYTCHHLDLALRTVSGCGGSRRCRPLMDVGASPETSSC